MKKSILLGLFICTLAVASAQENMLTLSYGYPIGNVEDVDENATGWRINALYEFNPQGGKVAHGLSIGYVSLGGDVTGGSFDVNSWPIYYAPKFMFGSDKFKGYVKGALGWQFSKVSFEGDGFLGLEGDDNDSGFTAGAGAGGMYFLKENVFLNLEYEFLWLSNSFYRDDALSTIALGVGFRF